MKELPLLEQSAKVQPSLGSSNFGSAFAEVAKADMQVAQFGADIAQNAATERARLAGLEAGKTPTDRNLFSFTKTDQAYVEAYKREAFSSQDFKGKQLINDMYSELAQNPTPDALQTFKAESTKAIDEFSLSVPKDLQADLRRSLETTAMNNFYTLESARDARQKEDSKNLWKLSVDQGTNTVMDLAINHDFDDAKAEATRLYDLTVQQEKDGIADAGTAERLKEMLSQTLYNGKSIRMMNASESPEKYLADLGEQKWVQALPENVKQGVVASSLDYFNKQEAAKAGQQGINYINYQTKIATAQMTASDWLQAETEVDGKQFAQLKYKQATMAAEGNIENRLLTQASQHSTDGAFLGAQYSTTQAEKIHNGLSKVKATEIGVNPEELSFKDRVNGSLGMHLASPRLNREANSTYRYGNLNQVREVADAILGAGFAGNPELFSDLTPESMVMSRLVNQVGFIQDPLEAEKRLKEIRQGIYNTTPEQKAEGKAQVNAYYKDNEFNDPALKNKHIVKALRKELGRDFFGSAKIPNELSAVYDNLMNAYTPMTNDPVVADEIALDIIKKGFTRTHINGRDEYMPLAPEQNLPASPTLIDNNKKLAVARLVKFNEELRSSGKAYLDKIEWPDMPTSGSPFEEKVWGNKGDIILNINGKPQKVIIKSDLMSQKGADQGVPNWAIYTQDADKPNAPELPLYFSDMPGFSQARWFPVLKEQQAMTIPEIKKVLEAMKTKKAEIDKRPKESLLNPILTLGGAL